MQQDGIIHPPSPSAAAHTPALLGIRVTRQESDGPRLATVLLCDGARAIHVHERSSGSECGSCPGLEGCGSILSGDAGQRPCSQAATRSQGPTALLSPYDHFQHRIRCAARDVPHLSNRPCAGRCAQWPADGVLSAHGVGPVTCVKCICDFPIFPIRL